MKYLKYVMIFAIPAVLGIYYGINNKKVPNGPVYIEQPITEGDKQESGDKEPTVIQNPIGFNSVETAIKEGAGVFSVYVKDLKTNTVYEQNSDYFYNAASVFKVFVATSVMKNIEQKNIGLDYMYKITSSDYEQGTGILQYEQLGSTYPVSQLLSLALKKSDNVAQNILMRAIKKNYISDSTFNADNESSARKVGVFLENFYENKFITKNSVNYLLDLMKETDFDDRINLGLSRTTDFAHKIGNWPSQNSWHDCGIAIKNSKVVVVCLMSKNTTFEEFSKVAKTSGMFVESLLMEISN